MGEAHRKGYNREREIADKLIEDGWEATLVPYSLGGYDVKAEKDIMVPINISGRLYGDKIPHVRIRVMLLIQAKYYSKGVDKTARFRVVHSGYMYSSTKLPHVAVVSMVGTRVKMTKTSKRGKLLLQQLPYENYPLTIVNEFVEEYEKKKKEKEKQRSAKIC